jgi:hypothetical protein
VALLVVAAVPAFGLDRAGDAAPARHAAWDSRVDRQGGRWTKVPVSTSRTTFTPVQWLALGVPAQGRLSVVVTGELEGGPARFRIYESHPGTAVRSRVLNPGVFQVQPVGVDSFSVMATAISKDSCSEFLELQWRSVSGQRVTLRKGLI